MVYLQGGVGTVQHGLHGLLTGWGRGSVVYLRGGVGTVQHGLLTGYGVW